jgi:hypothetical protein
MHEKQHAAEQPEADRRSEVALHFQQKTNDGLGSWPGSRVPKPVKARLSSSSDNKN